MYGFFFKQLGLNTSCCDVQRHNYLNHLPFKGFYYQKSFLMMIPTFLVCFLRKKINDKTYSFTIVFIAFIKLHL